jgi:hypothetical protein
VISPSSGACRRNLAGETCDPALVGAALIRALAQIIFTPGFLTFLLVFALSCDNTR